MAQELYTRNPRTAWTEFEDKTFVISADDSTLHELNTTGTFIWRQAEQRVSKDEIATRLSKEFDVDPEQALTDVDQFVGQLLSKGLLQTDAGK